jgi:hypothetical protein
LSNFNFNEETKKHEFKFLKTSYDAIDRFSAIKSFVFKEPLKKPISGGKVTIKRERKKNALVFNASIPQTVSVNDFRFDYLGFDDPLVLGSKQGTYYSDPRAVNLIKYSGPRSITGEISNLYTNKKESFNDRFLRMVVPASRDAVTSDIKGKSFTDKKTIYHSGLVRLDLKNGSYNFFRHENRIKKQHYLVIDSLNKESLAPFYESANSIIQAFSILYGNWYCGERFVLSSTSEMFDIIDSVFYEKTSNSILTNNSIINPFEFADYMRAIGEDVRKSENLFPDEVLSNIATRIIEDEELGRSLLLILEGNLALSPVAKSCSYLVAIETMAGLISKTEKEYFKTVKDETSSTELREEFNNIVNKYKAKLKDKEILALEKKIEYFNSPSGMDKILKSYEFYKIILPENFVKLLKERNLFLHGKTSFKENIVREKTYELMLNSHRFHLLACMLVLKFCGYRGHIKNLAGYRVHQDNKDVEDFSPTESVYYRI